MYDGTQIFMMIMIKNDFIIIIIKICVLLNNGFSTAKVYQMEFPSFSVGYISYI